MSISSLSKGPTTTHYLMLLFHHPKACVMYLYISPFYDLQAANVQNLFDVGCRPLPKTFTFSLHVYPLF
jgi:hypothetical protein